MQIATASAASGNNGRRFTRSMAEAEAVVTVSVVVAADWLVGVTDEGEKLHVAPAGRPEQAKETADENPPCGAMDTFVAALPPAATVRDAGDAITEKSGGTLMVYAALATGLARYPLATAMALTVCVEAAVIEPL